MFEGNWKCSSCGGAITQLPFQPRSESGLTCRTCYAKGKEKDSSQTEASAIPTASEAPDLPPEDAGVANEPPPVDDFADSLGATAQEKPKTEGKWTCSGCGAAITSLPFEPHSTNNLKCLDCYKASKN